MFKEHFHSDTLIYFELETHINFINSCLVQILSTIIYSLVHERKKTYTQTFTLLYGTFTQTCKLSLKCPWTHGKDLSGID